MVNQISDEWKVFICHVSEDKDTIAEPLANKLNQLNQGIWYDKFSMSPDDFIEDEIHLGLKEAKGGIIILSENFIKEKPDKRNWAFEEVSVLYHKRKTADGVFIPVFYKITRVDLPEKYKHFSNVLGFEVKDGYNLNDLAKKIADIIQDKKNKKEQENTFQIKHNLRSKRPYVSRTPIEHKIYLALNNKKPIILLHGVSGVGKSYIVENVLHNLLSKSEYTHLIFIKASLYIDFNSFLDIIIDVFDLKEIRRLNLPNKVRAINKLLNNSRTIITVDGFEMIRKDNQLVDFLSNIPHPAKVILTSTINIELDGIKYINISKVGKKDFQYFVNQMYWNITNSEIVEVVNWEAFYKLTGGIPHLISKLLSISIRRGFLLNYLISKWQSEKIKFDFKDLILNYLWDKEMEADTKRLTIALSIFPESVLIPTLSYMLNMSVKKCRILMHDLFEINFVELNFEKYDLHDIILHYTRQRVDQSEEYQNMFKTFKNRNYIYYKRYLTRNGGKANWKGFENINKNWKQIWATCQEAREDNENGYLIFFWRMLDDYLFYFGYYETRLKLIQWTQDAANQLKDDKSLPWIILASGEAEYFLNGNRLKASKKYEYALKIFKKSNNRKGIGYSLYELGRLYRHDKNNTKALQSHTKALKIAQSIKDKTLEAYCLNNIGKMDLAKGHFSKAENKFNISLVYWKQIKDLAMVGVTYRNMMQAHIANEKKVYSYYKKALNIFEKLSIPVEIAELKLEMSKILFSFKKNDEAKLLLNEAETTFKNVKAKTFLSRINTLKTNYIALK